MILQLKTADAQGEEDSNISFRVHSSSPRLSSIACNYPLWKDLFRKIREILLTSLFQENKSTESISFKMSGSLSVLSGVSSASLIAVAISHGKS
jgi:hypothetical protein